MAAIIKEGVDQEGEPLKENMLQYSGELDQYKEENSDKDLLDYFKGKISKEDYEILKISLFLRFRFRLKENVSDIKSDIIKRFGDRGKNIANLCSAEYFEEYIRPLWDTIHKSVVKKDEADQKFKKIFELIVRDGLLAVFVHHKMTEDKLAAKIAGKIEESRRYGFVMISDQLYVHALSLPNVKTVLQWIKNNPEFPNVTIVSEGPDFITVSIPIDHNALDAYNSRPL